MPLGNGRRTFHKRCGSLYASPTVDALLRFLHEAELMIALDKTVRCGAKSPLDCQSYQKDGPVFWHQSGKSGAVVAEPAEKRAA